MTDPKTLTVSEHAVLAALAGLPERFGLYDMLGVALPPKPSNPRLGGRKKWSAQWEAALKTWDVLKQEGMIRIVGYDAECRGNLYVITAAGRAVLAAAEGSDA